MSYESENTLPINTNIKDLIEFIETYDFIKMYRSELSIKEEVASFYWFAYDDYKSWTGVELGIYKIDAKLLVSTRTTISRSYWDLTQQNEIIRSIKKRFGGSFISDEGKNRYLHPSNPAPKPEQSGCHLAFQQFGNNLIKASIYLTNRKFLNTKEEKSGLEFLDQMNPRLLSNNLLLPFLIAIIEDYFKSTFIALLKYSKNKELFFKNTRISSEQLVRVSNKELTIEEAVAENMSFQNINLICQHFRKLDKQLDFQSILSKPYRRRKIKLFEELEHLVKLRHEFIHLSRMNTNLNDKGLKKAIKDIEVSIEKCYILITESYGWSYSKLWSCGK